MRFLTLSVFATLLSAPAFAADLGTYRPGTPYSSVVAAGADICDNQCAGDAQCRGWNYVKPNPRAAGVCEFLSTVSTPISSQISISGESESDAPYYSRLTAGSTNTVRVGTQTSPGSSTVRVGQPQVGRRIVRQAPPQQIRTRQASTGSVPDMSLTAQQNRYRQGQASVPKVVPQPQTQIQRPMPGQRPAFQSILDSSSPQYNHQHIRQPQARQPQINQPQVNQASRRVTGPRRAQGQGRGQATPQFQGPQFQGQAAPHFQNPQSPNLQSPNLQSPNLQSPNLQSPNLQSQGQGHAAPQFQDPRSQQARQQFQPPQSQQRGQSRPPIGQPIAAPARPKAMTPSQRLAQLTAKTRTQPTTAPQTSSVALSPEQARTSLFGRLNDDVTMPTASAVPTQPVAEQPLGDVLAGGL